MWGFVVSCHSFGSFLCLSLSLSPKGWSKEGRGYTPGPGLHSSVLLLFKAVIPHLMSRWFSPVCWFMKASALFWRISLCEFWTTCFIIYFFLFSLTAWIHLCLGLLFSPCLDSAIVLLWFCGVRFVSIFLCGGTKTFPTDLTSLSDLHHVTYIKLKINCKTKHHICKSKKKIISLNSEKLQKNLPFTDLQSDTTGELCPLKHLRVLLLLLWLQSQEKLNAFLLISLSSAWDFFKTLNDDFKNVSRQIFPKPAVLFPLFDPGLCRSHAGFQSHFFFRPEGRSDVALFPAWSLTVTSYLLESIFLPPAWGS